MIVQMSIPQFLLVYLLLLVVLGIMAKCRLGQTKLLLVASLRMTVQLVLAGLVLTYIFQNPHPLFTVGYVLVMTIFAIGRVLSRNKGLSRQFQAAIAVSLAGAGIAIVAFFVAVVVGESLLNPQYVIPLSGMIMGNAMTGVNLGVRAFRESLDSHREQLDTLLSIGATPRRILLPLVNRALETALLPTLNSMVGMGVVALPGMMTGQILSGTLPTTAILYQISIMIAICAVVCLSSFGALYLGYRTLYNARSQFLE